jgi:large subunit ribosomal protein L24
MQKIRAKDTVEVITGEHKGSRGEVLRVLRDKQKVVVSGVNIIKVHQKRTRESDGGIIEREAPLHISNVMVVCPRCGEPSGFGIVRNAAGQSVRRCKHCQEIID